MTRALWLCHFTVVDAPPPTLIEIAARAGFTAVSLMLQFPASYGPGFGVLGDTPLRRETRQRLDDTGLILHDASTCRLEPGTDVGHFEAMIESAAYLGARTVNVNGNDPDLDRLADRFAMLCELAAERGLVIGLEFMMSTQVRTFGDAVQLIERSGVHNAAITVDALHLARSGGSAKDVAALDTGMVSYVQLCDGPARVPPEGYAHEASRERMLPGDGELPLRELVDAVSPDVLLAVEAPSQRRQAQGVSDDAYAAQTMDSLRRLLREL